MIPTLSVPNIQVAPPVEISVFTGQNADAALGRLPVVTVAPAISNAKVADDNRGGQPAQRNAQNAAAMAKTAVSVAPFSLSGTGELVFESPYSTTFVAQLFGQFQANNPGALAGESQAVPLGVDFEHLSQFDVTKYMPSLAFRPRMETPEPAESNVAQQQPKLQIKNAPVQQVANAAGQADDDLRRMQPISSDIAGPEPSSVALSTEAASASASLFGGGGLNAYSSTQSRNQINLNNDSRGNSAEISLVL